MLQFIKSNILIPSILLLHYFTGMGFFITVASFLVCLLSGAAWIAWSTFGFLLYHQEIGYAAVTKALAKSKEHDFKRAASLTIGGLIVAYFTWHEYYLTAIIYSTTLLVGWIVNRIFSED